MYLTTMHRIVGFVAMITLAACEGSLQVGDGGSEPTTDATADATAVVTTDSVPDTASPVDAAGSPPIAMCNGLPAPGAWPSTTWSCPQSLCGNSVIDDCGGKAGPEACDGTAFGMHTCSNLGYVGGTLVCDSFCQIDARLCESCAPSALTSTCVHPTLGGVPPGTLALAANVTEVAMAWMEPLQSDPPPNPRVHFTRFGPDLRVLSDTGCLGPADAAPPVSVAAVPGGWLLAAGGPTKTTLIALDAKGDVTGSHDYPGSYGAQLTEQPGAGPLFSWSDSPQATSADTTGNLRLQLVGADGSAIGTDHRVGKLSYGWSAVYVDDGFEVAADVGFASGNERIQLVHLALDGTLRTDSSISGQQMYAVTMTWSGTQTAMVYVSMVTTSVDTSPRTLFVHVSQAGALLGSPLVLDASNDYAAYPVFSIGEDTAVLVVPDSGEISQLDIARLSPAGVPKAAPTPIVRAGLITSYAMAHQGTDAIVAWIDTPPYINHGNPADPLVQNRMGLQRVKLGM